MRVIQIGAYPPPYGGIAIHVQRLKCICESNNVECIVVNPFGNSDVSPREGIISLSGSPLSKLKSIQIVIRNFDNPIIHIHVSILKNFLGAGVPIILSARGLKRVITIHGGRFVQIYKQSSILKKSIFRILLSRFDRIIVVNEDLKKLLGSLKIGDVKIHTIPAFLPPLSTRIIEYDEPVTKVRNLKNRVDKICIVAGYARPYYGFHIMLDAIEELVKRNAMTFGTVIVFYNEPDKAYESQLMKRIDRMPNIMVFQDLPTDSYIELLKICDVFVRPTYADGDCVSLREAVYFGKQIVASDCIERPCGSVLFETGNPVDLAEKLAAVIKNSTVGIVPERMEENGDKILRIYQELARDINPCGVAYSG